MYRPADYGWMLTRSRIDGWTRALTPIINSTSVVVDVGAGIGAFSLIAARLGARKIYAIDPSPVAAVMREIVARNGLAGRIEVLQAKAEHVELDERADVVISDLGSALPLFDAAMPILLDARRRFLAPNGVMMPARERFWCALAGGDVLEQRTTAPWSLLDDFDLAPARTIALNSPSLQRLTPDDLLSAPVLWSEVDYQTFESPDVSGSVELVPTRSGMAHAIAIWFDAVLRDDIVLSSGPWHPESLHGTFILPLSEPLSIRAGEVVPVSIASRLVGEDSIATWSTPLGRQSTFGGETPQGAGEHLFARRTEDGGCLVADLRQRRYHTLNETAASVWTSLLAGASRETAAAQLAADYDIDSQYAAMDVDAIVNELIRAGLLG